MPTAPGHCAAGLVLQTWTEMHIGVGQSPGVVDLPVRRDPLTGWPVAPGTALRGVLRGATRDRHRGGAEPQVPTLARAEADGTPAVAGLFGPGRRKASDHAGAVSVGDGALLCWPVRALPGGFALLTCRAVVDRVNRARKIGGLSALPMPPRVKRAEAACLDNRFTVSSPDKTVSSPDKIVLEEFIYTRVTLEDFAAWARDFTEALALPEPVEKERLVCLHDLEFTHFAAHALPVRTHNALDYRTKNVQHGKLYQEESVPPEAVFFSLAGARAGRMPLGSTETRPAPGEVLAAWRAAIMGEDAIRILQFGGNASTGQGVCALRWLDVLNADGTEPPQAPATPEGN